MCNFSHIPWRNEQKWSVWFPSIQSLTTQHSLLSIRKCTCGVLSDNCPLAGAWWVRDSVIFAWCGAACQPRLTGAFLSVRFFVVPICIIKRWFTSKKERPSRFAQLPSFVIVTRYDVPHKKCHPLGLPVTSLLDVEGSSSSHAQGKHIYCNLTQGTKSVRSSSATPPCLQKTSRPFVSPFPVAEYLLLNRSLKSWMRS